jgi:hypothetical protein
VTINDDGAARFGCDDTFLAGDHTVPYNNHNYYWYEEAQSGREWLVPWDLDKSFDATTDVRIYPAWTASAPCSCTQQSFYGYQWPASCDPLYKHILDVLPDYEQAVDQFITGPFAKTHVDALIGAWSNQIRSHVSETAGLGGAPTEAQWSEGVAELKRIIDDARTNRGLLYQ